MTIRREEPRDHGAIREINEQAFGQPGEADLVEALRLEARPFISLVATEHGRAVGHICFSPVTIAGQPSPDAAGLAPMAVLPECQNRGIGLQLVKSGLAECRREGISIVVVVGHAGYYPRFGFVPASRRALTCEYPVPDDVFMVLELESGALGGRAGLVSYHAAFARL